MGSNTPDAVTGSPAVLWSRANDEFPHDRPARQRRYHELMVAHGHIVTTPRADDLDSAIEWLRVTHAGTLSGDRIEMVLEERRGLRAENERLVDLLRSALAVLRRIHQAGFNPAILDRMHEALMAHNWEPQE